MNDTPWNFGPSGGGGATEAVTLVDGMTFMLSRPDGSVHRHTTDGLFMLDTRVISHWELRLNGRHVEPLAVWADGPFGATFVGQVSDPGVADASVLVTCRRHVGRGLRDDISVRNHSTERRTFEVMLWAATDFAGLFDVKAGHTGDPEEPEGVGTARGTVIEPADRAATVIDRVTVQAEPHPTHTERDGLGWTVELDPGAEWTACVEVMVTAGGEEIEPAARCGTDVATAIPVRRLASWRASASRITTDHVGLDHAVRRTVDDLGALRIFDPDHPERTVVAAGAPWFMTLFGRDSLLTSWMALLVDHELALGVLAELAETQGRVHDATTEEQPGRILHEVRFDRLSQRLLGGSGRYYGSVDATPLFVMLVGELAAWLGPDPRLAALLPAADRALAWIDDHGDLTGDGFVDYERTTPAGLANQGWKDSWDGIRHRDGSIAVPPIALCEVQGYVYAALRARARLARVFGESPTVAGGFEQRAEAFAVRFDEAFWVDEIGAYCVGLDDERAQIASVTSNLGHLLWSGIVPEHRAAALAERLGSAELFSGWGVRTLASDAAGYNPLSYHCGSVWPHDTAIAIAGLARYGFTDTAGAIASGLIAASAASGGRLPELFGGFARNDIAVPVPYPASCSPQAWAAAAPLLIVRSLLGLEPAVHEGRAVVRPRLPEEFGEIRVSDLPLNGALLDVTARGSTAEMKVRNGDLECVVE